MLSATEERIRRDVVAAIDHLLREEMGEFGLKAVSVSAAEDHDGDPVLMVEAEYGPDGAPVEPRKVARLATKLRELLWNLGERRFPHIRHHFASDQRIAGYS
ncbi:hypothetical protein STVA_16860 [Allostella vacuolata]|nr:hypothetical protein STVA_16860 [Stella vacuolata]